MKINRRIIYIMISLVALCFIILLLVKTKGWGYHEEKKSMEILQDSDFEWVVESIPIEKNLAIKVRYLYTNKNSFNDAEDEWRKDSKVIINPTFQDWSRKEQTKIKQGFILTLNRFPDENETTQEFDPDNIPFRELKETERIIGTRIVDEISCYEPPHCDMNPITSKMECQEPKVVCYAYWHDYRLNSIKDNSSYTFKLTCNGHAKDKANVKKVCETVAESFEITDVIQEPVQE